MHSSIVLTLTSVIENHQSLGIHHERIYATLGSFILQNISHRMPLAVKHTFHRYPSLKPRTHDESDVKMLWKLLMKVGSGWSLASEKFTFTAFHRVWLVQLFQILSHHSCMFGNIRWCLEKKNDNKLWQMAFELLLLKLLIFLPSSVGN